MMYVQTTLYVYMYGYDERVIIEGRFFETYCVNPIFTLIANCALPLARRDRNVKVRDARLIHRPGRLDGKRVRKGMVLGVVDRGNLAEFDETGPGDGEKEGVVVRALWRLLIVHT